MSQRVRYIDLEFFREKHAVGGNNRDLEDIAESYLVESERKMFYLRADKSESN